MSAGAAVFTLAAAQAANSIASGYAQSAEAKANASILEGQASIIETQRSLEEGRITRQGSEVLSTSMANIGGAGIAPQGSAMAVMVRTQAQINIDKAITNYNYNMEKSYKMFEAGAERRRGKQAVYGGYMGGLTAALQGYSNYKLYGGATKLTTRTDTSGTTFDYSKNLAYPSQTDRLITVGRR